MNLESPINTINNIIAKHNLTHHISGRKLCKLAGVSSGYLVEIRRGYGYNAVLRFKNIVQFPDEIIAWAKEEKRLAHERLKHKAPVQPHWWHGVRLDPVAWQQWGRA